MLLQTDIFDYKCFLSGRRSTTSGTKALRVWKSFLVMLIWSSSWGNYTNNNAICHPLCFWMKLCFLALQFVRRGNHVLHSTSARASWLQLFTTLLSWFVTTELSWWVSLPSSHATTGSFFEVQTAMSICKLVCWNVVDLTFWALSLIRSCFRPAESQSSCALPQRLWSKAEELLQEAGGQRLRPRTWQDKVRNV